MVMKPADLQAKTLVHSINPYPKIAKASHTQAVPKPAKTKTGRARADVTRVASLFRLYMALTARSPKGPRFHEERLVQLTASCLPAAAPSFGRIVGLGFRVAKCFAQGYCDLQTSKSKPQA